MKAQVYWIDGPWSGRLAIVARPRGGDWLDDEVRAWKAAGIDVVVSSLTAEEATEFALQHEASTCESHGIRFLSFAISDRSVPDSRQEATQFLSRLSQFLISGQNVAIHCRQGIGRSGLIAGALLVLGGATFREAVATISRSRGCEVPETPEQRKWLVDFANADHPTFGTERAEHSGTS